MNPIHLILAIPATAAVLLAIIPSYKVAARLNVVAALITLLASAVPFWHRPETTPFLLIDDFNIYLVALTAFVGFTTSLFSARYVIHEVEIGRLVPRYLRFYHAMYQAFLLTMLSALTTNNLGVLWVSTAPTRRWRRPGSILSCAASASRWRSSGPRSCTSRRSR
jgi:hydrogenase-4 component F